MDMTARTSASSRADELYATKLASDTVRLERLLPGSVERVWSYLIDSDKRGKWLAAGPIELREGGAVNLIWRNSDLSDGQTNPNGSPPVNGIDHEIHGIVTRCEPPHVLAFNWSADMSGSESIFELSQEGADTKLVITQRRMKSAGQMLSMTAGWHTHVGILSDLINEVPPRLLWSEHARLVKVYESRFAD